MGLIICSILFGLQSQMLMIITGFWCLISLVIMIQYLSGTIAYADSLYLEMTKTLNKYLSSTSETVVIPKDDWRLI